VKESIVQEKKPLDHKALQSVAEKIIAHFSKKTAFKVKLVIGQKLFKRKQAEIKATIEESSHYR